MKDLFGDSKQKPEIVTLKEEDVRKKLEDFHQAKQDIEKACLD